MGHSPSNETFTLWLYRPSLRTCPILPFNLASIICLNIINTQWRARLPGGSKTVQHAVLQMSFNQGFVRLQTS